MFPVVVFVLSRIRIDWEFRETINLEKSACYFSEIKELAPNMYQRSTLQKMFFSYDDNGLEIRFRPDEKFDPDCKQVRIK